MSKRRITSLPLVPVHLTQVTTSDGIDLAGVVIEPKGKKQAALIWVHGLTSSFDSGQKLMAELSQACSRLGVGYFKFNTRGHHLVDYGSHTKKNSLIGATYEYFTDSVKDIAAVIALARRLGYRRLILAGHSTGANKVVHYMIRKQPRNIVGILLAGPVSDIVAQKVAIGKRKLYNMLRQAVKVARRHPNALMSMHWGGSLSAQRIVSLYTPGKPEDTFPWHDPKSRWTQLRRITQPLFIVFGSQDKHLDRPAKKVVELFRQQATQTLKFTGLVIPGATHGFNHHQKQLAKHISIWLRGVIQEKSL